MSRRSRATVGAEVKCSLCVQLSVLFARRDPAPTKGTIPPFAPRIWLNRLLPAHLPTTNATPAPQQHSRTNLTPHPSASVVPLSSTRTIQIQHTTAVRRGAASCRVVLRSCPVTAAALWGCRAPQTRQPERALAAHPAVAVVVPSRMSGRLPRRSSLCSRPLSAMRTDVRPTGRVDVRCPRVRCPCAWCPHDRCDPGVRTDTRPVSAAAATALDPEYIGAAGRPRLVHRVRRVAVVGERLVVAARIGPGGQKMVERWPCVARTRVDARLGAASQASRLRRRARRLADQGSWSRARCRSVGGGAGEEQVLPSPRRCVLGGCRRAGRPWAGPGGGDHARWSVRWWWSGVVRRWRAHPVQPGADCGRSAAAVWEERCPLGADSALTCENCGGRDRV